MDNKHDKHRDINLLIQECKIILKSIEKHLEEIEKNHKKFHQLKDQIIK